VLFPCTCTLGCYDYEGSLTLFFSSIPLSEFLIFSFSLQFVLLLQNEMQNAVKQRKLGEPLGETLLGKTVSHIFLGFLSQFSSEQSIVDMWLLLLGNYPLQIFKFSCLKFCFLGKQIAFRRRKSRYNLK
jgi:hypothetical protein